VGFNCSWCRGGGFCVGGGAGVRKTEINMEAVVGLDSGVVALFGAELFVGMGVVASIVGAEWMWSEFGREASAWEGRCTSWSRSRSRSRFGRGSRSRSRSRLGYRHWRRFGCRLRCRLRSRSRSRFGRGSRSMPVLLRRSWGLGNVANSLVEREHIQSGDKRVLAS
jgi:hypothetical protein